MPLLLFIIDHQGFTDTLFIVSFARPVVWKEPIPNSSHFEIEGKFTGFYGFFFELCLYIFAIS